jgi:chromosomal replication initiator protein
MPNAIKVIRNRTPLSGILPPMIIEIIQEYIASYVKENQILKFNVEFGYIEESVMIDVKEDFVEQSDRTFIMTYQARLIEAFLFDHYKVNKDINPYIKIRNREIIRVRQVIQFFMAYYSTMPLLSIGFVTGKKDHATVMHSKKVILKRIKEGLTFKKGIFMLDLALYKKLGLAKSLVFDALTNLKDLP